MTGEKLPRRKRVARLSWLTIALVELTLVLLLLAVWVASREEPKDIVGQLPLGADDNVPSISLILAAGAAAAGLFVGLAALHAAAAMRILARDRRIPHSLSPEKRRLRAALLTPLGPSAVRLADEPELPPSKLPVSEDVARPPLRLTVLVPAHNEALTITATLQSLWGQTRPPDKVVVVADNCTDDTADLAREHGADVFTTVGNTEKKAGALNQALSEMFRDVNAGDVAMVMDADSVIVPGFLETAMGRLEADPDLIAVGGVFYGEGGAGLVGQLQRNEYTRYQRDISRRQGRVFVLTGTASLFRAYALKAVADSRGELLPGDPGQVYDTLALTEDNEMTLSLRSLGAKMVSPMQCRVVTEVMPTWRALWRQRMRWQRGALENIGAYGLTRATLRYWLQQIGNRLRNDRAELLPAADADHPARGRQFPVRLVLGGYRLDLRDRALGHRLGGRLAGQSDSASTGDRDRIRPGAPGRLRQVPLRHRHRPCRRMELRPARRGRR